MHGTTAAVTPQFDIPRKKYSVVVACMGSGTITVDNVKSKPKPCDGRTRRAHVYTDAKTAVVPITPHGAIRWSVAVVDSDIIVFAEPTPTSTRA